MIKSPLRGFKWLNRRYAALNRTRESAPYAKYPRRPRRVASERATPQRHAPGAARVLRVESPHAGGTQFIASTST